MNITVLTKNYQFFHAYLKVTRFVKLDAQKLAV